MFLRSIECLAVVFVLFMFIAITSVYHESPYIEYSLSSETMVASSSASAALYTSAVQGSNGGRECLSAAAPAFPVGAFAFLAEVKEFDDGNTCSSVIESFPG